MIILLLWLTAVVSAGTPTVDKETYKNQSRRLGHAGKHNSRNSNSSDHCTDPRTMKKHPAYTEWADTYSCTRHRCQPGGRNLAIYTVGCKRIEAPESAIECEEVVEDTNMQFPFCCTRLRCLVLVRGEVWTKVLGQPWEILPAAPWSHMYKMKKPPPAGSTAVPKTQEQGPIFELSENEPEAGAHDKVPRSGKKPVTDNTNWNEKDPAPVPSPAMPLPDIATESSTNEGKESHKSRRNKRRNSNARTPATYVEVTESEKHTEPVNLEVEETPATTDKPQEIVEDETEKYFPNNADIQKAQHKSHKSHNMYRPEIPQNQWNEPTEGLDLSEHLEIPSPNVEDLELLTKKEPAEKPSNLQVLVDAIGTRMRDIESVVQKMSDKVQNVKPDPDCSTEKRTSAEREGAATRTKEAKRPSTEDDTYKRFLVHSNVDSKYLHSTADSSTENPLFIEDTNLTGYFSDASNSVLRRKNPLKDLKPTYMAPVENHRKAHVIIADPDNAENTEKKHKKHSHKKRKNKGSHSHKKRPRSKDDKRKHFKKLPEGSVEAEKNAISLDDSSGAAQ